MPTPRRGRQGRDRRITTAEQILDEAERLMQTRGFNGFSYADISAALGITKAALHYHFATKADLGQTVIQRYTERFAASLAEIDRQVGRATDRLRAYVQLFADVVTQNRLCLCGMMAAEYTTLPAEMQAAIRAFFDRTEAWLAPVMDEARSAGELRFEGDARDSARALTAELEGAMLLARAYGDAAQFTSAVRQRLWLLGVPQAN